MHRIASFLLIACFIALGSGAMEYVHNLEHAKEDALEDKLTRQAGQPVEEHHHDESNCQTHAQLHLPVLATAWVPILIALGLWIAFLTLRATPLIPRMLPVRIDCRGPPACWSFR